MSTVPAAPPIKYVLGGNSSLVRRVTCPKLSNATYTQGHSLVKVNVNIFCILFRHTLRGTVKWVSGCLCWVMAKGSRLDDLPLGLLCTNPLTWFHCFNCRPTFIYPMANLHLLIYWLYIWTIRYISFKEWLTINTQSALLNTAVY